MSNTSPQSSPSGVEAIYTQLKQHDIEQFYAGYQLWKLHQQIAALQCEIDGLQQQISENAKCLEEVQPSAIALATLARLQANGVSDLDLLDRLLEQGEIWLDRTIQRLDYCEQLDDFILDDYTQWCIHALEGAYDWIDSIQEDRPEAPLPGAAEERLTEATEELFLQKLTSDEDEDEVEASMLETTLKRPAITVPLSEEAALLEQPAEVEQEDAPTQEEPAPTSEEPYPGEEIAPAIEEYIPVPEGPVSEEDLFIYTDEQLDILEYLVPEETPPTEETSISEGGPGAIQDDVAFEEAITPETEQPAIHEQMMTDSGEDAPAADTEEPVLLEQVALEEPLAIESSSFSGDEHPQVHELDGAAPASEDPAVTAPGTAQQSEVPVAPEASTLESEQHQAHDHAQGPVESSQQPQIKLPEKPSFLERLIKKMWGS